jgi:hypothetical protein
VYVIGCSCLHQSEVHDANHSLQPADRSVAAVCDALGDLDGFLGPLVRNVDHKELEINKRNCLNDAGYSNGASVTSSLRHFAIIGNAQNDDFVEYQVDLSNVLSDRGLK